MDQGNEGLGTIGVRRNRKTLAGDVMVSCGYGIGDVTELKFCEDSMLFPVAYGCLLCPCLRDQFNNYKNYHVSPSPLRASASASPHHARRYHLVEIFILHPSFSIHHSPSSIVTYLYIHRIASQ